VYQAALWFFAGSIELLNLRNDLLIKRQYITRLDVRGLVLLDEEERIAGSEQAFEDGLFPRIQRDRDSGGLHGDKLG
jgi:hypothetical protein